MKRKTAIIATLLIIIIGTVIYGKLTDIKKISKTVAATPVPEKYEKVVREAPIAYPEVKVFETIEAPADPEPEELPKVPEEELDISARCVMAEAGDQGEGIKYVVDVILNRVDSPDWPDTITGVITQKGQFSSYWDGGMQRHKPTKEVYEWIEKEYANRSDYNIIYFRTGHYHSWGTPAFKYKDHYFSSK